MPSLSRRRGWRRWLGILRTLEALSDDQVLLCSCGGDHSSPCGG